MIGHILHVLTARCAGPSHARQVQARLVVLGLSSNTTLASRFIDVCHSLGLPHLALPFFARLPRPHVFICNTLIRAFSLSRTPRVPFSVYTHMRRNSVRPNNFTFPFLLKSLADSGEFGQGLCVHAHVAKFGHLEDIFVRNSLLNLYASGGGDLALCRRMFDEMPHRDVVSWTILITGYRKVRRFGDVLMAFERMLLSGLDPNRVTMVNVLAACSSVREVGMGMWVHDFVRRRCWELDVTLGTALVNMYMRCGRVDEGLKAFHSVKEKSVSTWNMVIKGLALVKNGDEAVSWFSKMQQEGVKVDGETLVAVLSACSRSGLIDKGREIFSALIDGEFGISAGIKHYECVIDLLVRGGCQEDALELIRQMPFEPTKTMCRAILAGSTARGKLSELAARNLIELEPENGAYYVLLSDLYTEIGRWSDVEKVRGLMEERGLQKDLGRRFLEHRLQDSFPESHTSPDCASEREAGMISSSIVSVG
ncbi:hypothetical protein ACJRO7_030435 [Eucalyptus globulus]|uniref:Pentatricopeptide repeat-containing protein n=1 Tax=Eucalyptus globulus TaxID=34317 RepID=A0ABD3JMD3_EUCGL